MSSPPSFQFYPGDWLKDTALRSVSAAARGTFIDLLCLAHCADRRGVLRVNGEVLSPEKCAKMVGVRAQFVRELLKAGVLKSSARTGTIFSARMLRDAHTALRRAICGRIGGKQIASKSEANVKQTPKQNRPPSSSSSSSSSEYKKTPTEFSPDGETPPEKTPRQKREPDPIWDTVAAEWFASGVTPTQRTRVGKLVRDLRALHATPNAIREHRKAYRQAWPEAADTPEAVVKHWDQFKASEPAFAGWRELVRPDERAPE